MKISQMIFKLQSGHKYMMEIFIYIVRTAVNLKVGYQCYGYCVLHCISCVYMFE